MTDPFAGNRCQLHNMPLTGSQSCLACDPDKATRPHEFAFSTTPGSTPYMCAVCGFMATAPIHRTLPLPEAATEPQGYEPMTMRGVLCRGCTARDAEVTAQAARIAELERENAAYKFLHEKIADAPLRLEILQQQVEPLTAERDRLRLELTELRAACEPIMVVLQSRVWTREHDATRRLAALLAPKPGTKEPTQDQPIYRCPACRTIHAEHEIIRPGDYCPTRGCGRHFDLLYDRVLP